MAENKKRSLFGFHGLTGVAISIVGLLSILVALQLMGIVVQRKGAVNPYDPTAIRDVNNLKMISVDNKKFAFIDAKNKEN